MHCTSVNRLSVPAMLASCFLLLSSTSIAPTTLASPVPQQLCARAGAGVTGNATVDEAFVLRATQHDGFAPSRPPAKKRLARRQAQACAADSPKTTTRAPANVGGSPGGSSTSTTSSQKPTPTSGGGGGGGGEKPANWPTKTQSGPTYSATVATSSDPYLKSISEALNFKNTKLFTEPHTGDLTYYATGMTACGDFYEDSSYTASISHQIWSTFPGASPEYSRNPICGPFTPGRQVLDASGSGTVQKIPSSIGSVLLGGDGLPNCVSTLGFDPSSAAKSTGLPKCHIPLRARITKGSKSVVVDVVDRCDGCEGEGDIDVTPTVFKALMGGSLDAGRVSGVTWQFVQY